MPTIYTPNVAMIEMIYVQGTQRMENIYHVTNGAPPTLANLQALWTIFRDWENNTARQQRSNQCSLVLIALASVHAAGAPVYEQAVTPPILGNNGTAPLPSMVSLAIKHTTGLGGRSYRGRTYWVGMPTGLLTAVDFISQANANIIAGHYNTLRTTLAGAGWTLVVVSKYSGVDSNGRAIPRPAGIATPIVNSSAEAALDTQRHRKVPYQV